MFITFGLHWLFCYLFLCDRHIYHLPINLTVVRIKVIKVIKLMQGYLTRALRTSCQICHGPAGVPRLATRCLCLLSTWLVVCLVPCAPMSIVCPLPSCYLIIVSVAPAVSPSLPSFVSLYSSPCVCSPVLIRCLSCVFVM